MQELHGESPGGVHAGAHKKESRTEGKSVRPDGKRNQELVENTNASQASQPRRFNPWQLFLGSMIPNALQELPGLSDKAKMLWGRLAQYAGRDGACYPAQATLAKNLATNERQIRRALVELIQGKFLETDTRGRAGTRYYFLWHPCFDHAEPLPKPAAFTHHVIPRFAPKTKSIPDIADKNPDKVSAKENQEKNQEENTYPYHRRPARPKSGGFISEISNAETEEYIDLRTRYRVWQGENGHLPKLLVPSAYTGRLRKEESLGTLRTGDLEYLRCWAKSKDEAEESRQKLAAAEAYLATPRGQEEARKASEETERSSIERLKQTFMAWRSENQAWTWEDLSKEAEEWTPVVKAQHWHDIRFKWRVPPLKNRIIVALRELATGRTSCSQLVSCG